MGAGLGVDAHRVAVATLESGGEFSCDLGGLVLVKGHVGLLHGREHLRGPPHVDGVLNIGILEGQVECRLGGRIEVRRGGIAPEKPRSHDGHALAVATGQCLVDLSGPFLRSRVKDTATRRRPGAHFVLTKERNHAGGAKLARPTPVGEAEPVDRRIKAVV
ncbi:unannotated protein [freshwater metagenome]|uniref:Unannotated protein n=1 Tax=freshwater metagenome TaxID=449393 RepID=A0A6J7ID71_9ZZZZ